MNEAILKLKKLNLLYSDKIMESDTDQIIFTTCGHTPLNLICFSMQCSYIRLCSDCLFIHLRNHSNRELDTNIIKISSGEFERRYSQFKELIEKKDELCAKLKEGIQSYKQYDQEIKSKGLEIKQMAVAQFHLRTTDFINSVKKMHQKRKNRVLELSEEIKCQMANIESLVNIENKGIINELSMESDKKENNINIQSLTEAINKVKTDYTEMTRYSYPRFETIEREKNSIAHQKRD